MAKIKEHLKFLNPFHHKQVIRLKYKTVFKTYFTFLILGLILFTLVVLPRTAVLGNNVDNSINKFDELSLKLNTEHQEQILVSKNPKIIIDLNNDTHIKSNIMITENQTHINIWPIEKTIENNEFKDLKNRSSSISLIIGVFAMILVPGLIVTYGVFNIIESLLLSFIFAIIGIVIVRVFKKDLSIKKLFKLGIISSGSLFLFNALFVPLLLNFWFPALIYFLFFSFGAILTSNKIGFEPKTEKKKKEKKEKAKTGKKRTKEIFGESKKTKNKDDDFIMLD
jgi:hypothetical protein